MCFRPPEVSAVKTCSKCGAKNDAANSVCGTCGAELPMSPVASGAPGVPQAPGAPNSPGAPGVVKAPGAPRKQA